MARQAIPEAQEFPQQRRAVLGELGEVDAALRAAHRGDQRDRQDVEQFMPLRIPPPRVGNLSKRVDQGHGSSSGTHGRIQINPGGKPYSSNAIPLGIWPGRSLEAEGIERSRCAASGRLRGRCS
jgi:hypothetical protein